jgi:hypothetical protein
VREWGVWNDLDEAAGKHLFQSARGGSSLEERPATSFDGSEFTAIQASIVPTIVVGWDAFFIPENADLFIFVSLDAYASVVGRTDRMHQTLLEYLEDWPPVENDLYFSRRSIKQ